MKLLQCSFDARTLPGTSEICNDHFEPLQPNVSLAASYVASNAPIQALQLICGSQIDQNTPVDSLISAVKQSAFDQTDVRLLVAISCVIAQRRVDATGPPIENGDIQTGLENSLSSGTVTKLLALDGEEVVDPPVHANLLRAAIDLLIPFDEAPASPGEPLISSSRAFADEHESCKNLYISHWLWAFRALAIQQRCLHQPSKTIRGCMAACLSTFLRLIDASSIAQQLSSCAKVEAAVSELDHGLHVHAQTLLQSALSDTGLNVELTGALGYRTLHQREPCAQLVAQAKQSNCSTEQNHLIGNGNGTPEWNDDPAVAALFQATDEQLDGESKRDVLDGPQLLHDDGFTDELYPKQYPQLQHALMLAQGAISRAQSARDELRPWEEAAWARAVLADRANACACALFAATLVVSRAELERSRTCERGLVRLERLADALEGKYETGQIIPQKSHIAGSRINWSFAVQLPSINALRRELGDAYYAAGFMGQALNEYKALKLWHRVIACYRSLGKREQACALLQEQLDKVGWNDAALLCALGEAQTDPSLLKQAWEVSGHRHARSKRGLARDAMQRKHWAEACTHWEDALSLSSLHSSDWFAFGHCCMQVSDWQRAHEAFTRSAQIDPSSGESWNNAAAVALRLNKDLSALEALKEATRLLPNDWRAHENAATAALRVGQVQKAANSLYSAFKASAGERLDEEGIDAIVQRLVHEHSMQLHEDERCDANRSSSHPDHSSSVMEAAAKEDNDALAVVFDALADRGIVDDDGDIAATTARSTSVAADGSGMSTADATADAPMNAVEIARAVRVVEDLLKEAAQQSSCTARTWRCLAQVRELKGEVYGAKECRAKQVKRLHGSAEIKRSEVTLQEYADACCKLCEQHAFLGENERARMVARSAAASVSESLSSSAAASQLHSLRAQYHTS